MRRGGRAFRGGCDAHYVEAFKANLPERLAGRHRKITDKVPGILGHTHDWHREERDGLHFINLPPVAWIFKEGRPAGWVDTHLHKDGATLELRSLDTKHPLHGEKYELKWR